MLVTGESFLRTADSSPKPQTLNQFCAARPFEVLPGYTPLHLDYAYKT